MKIICENKGSFEGTSGLVLVPVTQKDVGTKLGAQIREINELSGGALANKLARHKYTAKPMSAISCELSSAKGVPTVVVLVGVSDSSDKDSFDKIGYYRRLGNLLVSKCRSEKLSEATLLGQNLNLKNVDNAAALVEGLLLGSYEFDRYKSKKKENGVKLEKLTIRGVIIPPKIIDKARISSEATNFARDLVNTPALDCTPTHLLQEARKIAKDYGLKLDAYDLPRLKKMGAGGILAVSAGSDEPPYLIKLTYKPKGKPSKVISIVGKGVTFDSGGLSIKPAGSMETMKDDMSGAAAVLGAMKAISQIKPKAEVRAYIPTTENMINGKAIRPGDVIRAMNGKSIEILNTDAEGRLILADALSLAEKDKCDLIVDLATLTGACVVALGSDYAAMFTKEDRYASRLSEAASAAGERLWRMPLAPEYRDLIKSNIADIKNTGGKWGGAITAALFLNEFVDKTPWIHLDIAGPAFSEGEKEFMKRGGAGFAVRTLVRFLEKF